MEEHAHGKDKKVRVFKSAETGAMEFTVGGQRVYLDGCYRQCGHCGQSRRLTEFGLRTMGDGTVRLQPRCNWCPR